MRLREDVKQGAQINEEQLETAELKSDSLPKGTITDKKDVVGKYASANLFKGDCFTKAKLSEESNTASDVLAGLDGKKVAMSISIDSFAAGLSGKLQNGDIISLIVVTKDNVAAIPGELKYVKVITTTTSEGIDQDSVIRNDDGSFEIPSTITVLVSPEQAKLIAQFESNCTINAALVYRGTADVAAQFIQKQDEFLDKAKTQQAVVNGEEAGNG